MIEWVREYHQRVQHASARGSGWDALQFPGGELYEGTEVVADNGPRDRNQGRHLRGCRLVPFKYSFRALFGQFGTMWGPVLATSPLLWGSRGPS